MNTINTISRPNNIQQTITEARRLETERRQNNISCIPALAIFYDAAGQEVWSCKKDMRYHLTNGTTAINKGAVRGVLVNLNGDKLEELEYRT